MQYSAIDRHDSRLPISAPYFHEEQETVRLALLEHIRSLMAYYVKAGYIHRSLPRVDRKVIVRIIVDQDDTVCFEDCLDCLLVLVAYSPN